MRITSLSALITIMFCLAVLTGCDDGPIHEKEYVPTTTGYTAVVKGTFKKQSTWTSGYSVVVAGFSDKSDYAIIQKTLAAKNNEDTEISTTLSNISDTTKTLEIAVVNSLRKRVATLFSYEIPANQQIKDTIRLNVGELNVGMFATINKEIFQGKNCSRCHASPTATAHLDLTSDNAYKSIVGVESYKNPEYMRVKPGSADSSFLYKVITTGDERVAYNHPALFVDSKYATFQTIIKKWINDGAKE